MEFLGAFQVQQASTKLCPTGIDQQHKQSDQLWCQAGGWEHQPAVHALGSQRKGTSQTDPTDQLKPAGST